MVTFVAAWEGCSLTAYRDPVGIWTIGYGHKVPLGGSRDPISQQEATDLLQADLGATMRGLMMYINSDIDPKQNEADAICSLAFNVGVNAVSNSHLLYLYNEGLNGSAAMEFPRWNGAGGQVLPGLVKRRAAEQQIFLYGTYDGRQT